MLHLNCGYSKTGKDTLFQLVKAGWTCQQPCKAVIPSMPESKNIKPLFFWYVYALPKTEFPEYGDPSVIERIASADILKEQVCTGLNLKGGFRKYEPVKDTLMCGDPAKLLRHHFIDVATEARKTDIDCWIRKALEPHIPSKKEDKESSEKKPLKILFKTDWRHHNEKAYAAKHYPIKTHRQYRSDVSIAPLNVESEHQLDKEVTDYLWVTSEEEFQEALKLFPQYKDFQLLCQFRPTSSKSTLPHFEKIQIHILNHIDSADSLYVCSAWLNDSKLIQALSVKSASLVIVGSDISESILKCFKEHNVPVFRYDKSNKSKESITMHHKFIVLMKEVLIGHQHLPYAVITGSYNYTNKAIINKENVVYIDEVEVACTYASEFQKLLMDSVVL